VSDIVFWGEVPGINAVREFNDAHINKRW